MIQNRQQREIQKVTKSRNTERKKQDFRKQTQKTDKLTPERGNGLKTQEANQEQVELIRTITKAGREKNMTHEDRTFKIKQETTHLKPQTMTYGNTAWTNHTQNCSTA